MRIYLYYLILKLFLSSSSNIMMMNPSALCRRICMFRYPSFSASSLSSSSTTTTTTSSSSSPSTSSTSYTKSDRLSKKSSGLEKTPRIFVSSKALAVGSFIQLDDETSHYIANVMRMKEGQQLRVFNGINGEFLAQVLSMTKKKQVTVEISSQTRSMSEQVGQIESILHINLLFAPIKKARLKIMFEKATEIGVSAITPVITQRTTAVLESAETLRKTVVESCEQSERLTIPRLSESIDLSRCMKSNQQALTFLQDLDVLFVCAERSPAAVPVLLAMKDLFANDTVQFQSHDSDVSILKIGVLVGPEGGFTNEEMNWFDTHVSTTRVVKISLGNSVLRSETAAIFALSCIAASLAQRGS